MVWQISALTSTSPYYNTKLYNTVEYILTLDILTILYLSIFYALQFSYFVITISFESNKVVVQGRSFSNAPLQWH